MAIILFLFLQYWRLNPDLLLSKQLCNLAMSPAIILELKLILVLSDTNPRKVTGTHQNLEKETRTYFFFTYLFTVVLGVKSSALSCLVNSILLSNTSSPI